MHQTHDSGHLWVEREIHSGREASGTTIVIGSVHECSGFPIMHMVGYTSFHSLKLGMTSKMWVECYLYVEDLRTKCRICFVLFLMLKWPAMCQISLFQATSSARVLEREQCVWEFPNEAQLRNKALLFSVTESVGLYVTAIQLSPS